ncbi:hypothetical protein [Cohnella hongkongensis]|uniref:Uncharacterized protein n=1 Tax=Cohnella hongkongensis TaxID=178337 RepID=A0ABV9FBC7_9BACL
MKKIRILPITITAALTAAILFGGWFAYRHYGIEKPLDKVAVSVPGVEAADVHMTGSLVKISVELDAGANLGEVYRTIKQDGAGEIGSRQLELKVTARGSELLDKAWSYSLFDVAEAMENRKYSGVREAMEKLSEPFPGVTATTDIDENNVYVSLRDGDAAKFVVLPRQPAMLGVWPNA